MKFDGVMCIIVSQIFAKFCLSDSFRLYYWYAVIWSIRKMLSNWCAFFNRSGFQSVGNFKRNEFSVRWSVRMIGPVSILMLWSACRINFFFVLTNWLCSDRIAKALLTPTGDISKVSRWQSSLLNFSEHSGPVHLKWKQLNYAFFFTSSV